IRDFHVTGVQTCALPISTELLDLARTLLLLGPAALDLLAQTLDLAADAHALEPLLLQRLAGLPHPGLELLELAVALAQLLADARSEERRVGKGGRCRGLW